MFIIWDCNGNCNENYSIDGLLWLSRLRHVKPKKTVFAAELNCYLSFMFNIGMELECKFPDFILALMHSNSKSQIKIFLKNSFGKKKNL